MNTEKLITAYSEFMQHLHETMEDTLNSFTDEFETSKEKVGENSELTTEELDHVIVSVLRGVFNAVLYGYSHLSTV